jgi:hypothetical protein
MLKRSASEKTDTGKEQYSKEYKFWHANIIHRLDNN